MGGDSDDKAKKASDEVASRLTAYLEGLRYISLKCAPQMRKHRRCTDAKSKDESGVWKSKVEIMLPELA